jgi:ABC-type sugar transport system substrate-binding protein
MFNLKYILITVGVITLILLLFFGGEFFTKSLGNDEGIKYLIGVSQSNLLEPWQVAMNDEIKAEAAKYPDVKVIFFDAAQDNTKQKQDIENLIKQRVDLLIISPGNPNYLTDTISNIYKHGTPVIMMEYPIASADYSMHIYSDNRTIGKNAGELVGEWLGKRGGSVLEVQGDPESLITIERKKGFREALSNYPNIKINYVVVGYWSMGKTEVRVLEIYRKKPQVDVVFAHNDSMAIGAWKIAKQEGVKAKFIGIDGLLIKHGGIDAVKTGMLQVTFRYPTGGKEALINALKILRGEKVPKHLELPTMRITKKQLQGQ